MPSWGEILVEVNESAAVRNGQPDLDGIRDKYIARLHEHSGRAIIVYASGWLQSSGEPDIDYLVNGKDVHAFMEVCKGVTERQLDLVLHSPGGVPSAAEQVMQYLRTRFDYIRVIVPLQAKSAGTMMALGCDEVVLGAHSELGPIDPQIAIQGPEGTRFSPAIAILRDWEKAQAEIAKDITKLAGLTPLLRSYVGGLLEYCEQQIALSQDVVAGWLEKYMLRHEDVEISEDERGAVARAIAEHFGSKASYDRFRDHGRPIRIEELQGLRGVRVRRLEDDNELQDIVLSIYHALDFTLSGPGVKVVENHLGKRWVRIRQQLIFQASPIPGGPQPGEPAVIPAPQPNRPPFPPKADRPRKKRR